MIRRLKIHPHERGLLFREGDLIAILQPGVHWRFDPLFKLRLHRVSTREAWLQHKDRALIIRSGLLSADDAVVINLPDDQRGLVWLNGRFNAIVEPAPYVIWKTDHDVRVEIVSTRTPELVHSDLAAILKNKEASAMLETVIVEPGHVALVYRDGSLLATHPPGTYAYWKDSGVLKIVKADLREQVIDICGQEIMTADKVTLRMNALVTFRIIDVVKMVVEAGDATQALYRAAQLALRELVGAKDLDSLLATRDALAGDLEAALATRAASLGMVVISAGIRDVILPGDMKELMNKVTEAKKASEASLITRREETAAMRMQANTAKILESSPTLMKLRELEVLEKVANKANLTVVVGDGGNLSDRVVKLL